LTLVLDSGAVSTLATSRARLAELRRRGLWPAEVPSVVLVESLTGDHRRDFHTNRLLRACRVRAVGEPVAREAARLRTATGRADDISVTDAVLVAYATERPGPIVMTGDPEDLRSLAAHASVPVTIAPV
jgi:hypothetical protein